MSSRPDEQELPTDRQDTSKMAFAGFLETVGYAVAAGSFCYFILCFAYLYSFSINVDKNLLLYVPFQDYLKAGIWINLYFLVFMVLTILSIRTGLHVLPNLIRNDILVIEQRRFLEESARAWLPRLFWIFLLLVLSVRMARQDNAPNWVSWLFWVSIVISFFYTMLSVHTKLLLPTAILIIAVAFNVYAGYLLAPRLQQAHATVRIHLMDATETKITGSPSYPVANGIVFVPAGVCDRPKDRTFHFISWDAVKLVEDIPPHDCPPSPEQPKPPVT